MPRIKSSPFTSAYDDAGSGAPALLLHGAETREPTLRTITILKAGLCDVRIAAIPGAGHMSPITHRELVNAEIVRHIMAHAD